MLKYRRHFKRRLFAGLILATGVIAILRGWKICQGYHVIMPDTVHDALKYSNGARQVVWSQLKNTPFESNPRTSLVLAYLAIALEHEEAIARLVEMKLYAPAFALLRLQLEAAFRGLWVNLIASDPEITAISQDGAEPFPRFREMAAKLDEMYGADGWIASFTDRWSTLNGFTHSGLEQLGRRFHADGNIAPNYSDAMISELVTVSGTLLIGMVMPIFRKMGFNEKATVLDKWLDESVHT